MFSMNFTLNQGTLEYIAVTIAVLGMGSLYFQVLRMPIMAAMLLIVAALFLLKKPLLRKSNFILYLCLTGAFVFTSVVNYKNGFYLNDLIIWMVNMIFVMVLQTNMTFREFKKKYVIVISIEAVISLICFLWVNILGHSLPLMSISANRVNTYYLTPYYTAGWGNLGIFDRNAGIFTEPGAHQIFLNFALLFLLSDDTHFGLSKRKYVTSAVILFLTILTTQSTTGYMCLAVVMVAIVLKRTDRNKHTKLKFLMVIAMVILMIIESQTGIIENKFAGIKTGHGSGLTRYMDTYYGYYIAFSRPVFGHGMYMTNQAKYMTPYGINNISNGMASFAIRAGVIITIIFLVMMYKGLKKQFPYGKLFNICVFILYFLCVNSEGLFLNILFLTFIGNWCDKPIYKIQEKFLLQNR